MLRINLGSGQRPFGAGWTNVDSQARWLPDVCAEGGEYLKQQADASAELICLHHVLEHYGCGESAPLVRECHRVLAPGGSLLIFVPDLNKLARMWIEGMMDTQVFLTNVYGAYMDDEADRHRWGFTPITLRRFLRENGFTRTLAFDWREIPGADIARDDRWICGMEAVKC